MRKPAQVKASREGAHNVMSAKQSSCVLKNNELKTAQVKHSLPVIMQVDEPVLTENYVPRVPTVNKSGTVSETKRFFGQGLIKLKYDDTLDELTDNEEFRDAILE